MEYAIVLLPLLGSIISGFFGKRLGAKLCQILTSLFVSISAILSLFIFYKVIIENYSSNKVISNFTPSIFSIKFLFLLITIKVGSSSSSIFIFSLGLQ